jgi:hypothetical protein
MQPQFKPPAGWPTIDETEGPFVRPAWSPPRTVDGRLVPGPAPDAFMDTPDGPVALYAHPAQQAATSPMDVPATFQPDPWPKRLVAGGICAVGVGGGAGLLFHAMAQATTAIVGMGVCLAIVYLMRMGGGGGSGKVAVNVRVDNRSYGGRR